MRDAGIARVSFLKNGKFLIKQVDLTARTGTHTTTMASTPSNDELTRLREENKRLLRQSTELYHQLTACRGDLDNAMGYIQYLRNCVDDLRARTGERAGSDEGAAAAGGGTPRCTYGSFYPDEDADGGAAAAGGGPPVARTPTSNGPVFYRGVPALGPSNSEYGPCTGGEADETDGIPAITHADHVALCATPSDPDLAVKVIAPGIAAWYRPP